MTGPRALEPREQRFVDEYLVDLNGSAAAIRAGYAVKAARQQATDLLSRPHIAAAVQIAKDARAERTRVTADAVVTDLNRVAHLDPWIFLDHQMNLRPAHEIPPEIRSCVEYMKPLSRRVMRFETVKGPKGKVRRRRVTEYFLGWEIKLVSKSRAYELLARHVGIYQGDGAPVAPPPPAFALPPGTKRPAIH